MTIYSISFEWHRIPLYTKQVKQGDVLVTGNINDTTSSLPTVGQNYIYELYTRTPPYTHTREQDK